MIEITIGKLHINKSQKYLSPILNSFNKNFFNMMLAIKKHINCYAIGDVKYNKVKQIGKEYLLFVVVDRFGPFNQIKKMYQDDKIGVNNFNNFLRYFRASEYFFDDYPFEHKSPNLHCLVIKLPDKWEYAYKEFLNSRYSKMYTPEDLAECKIQKNNSKGYLSPTYAVLTKAPEYRDIFCQKLNEHYGTNIEFDYDDDREFDLPILKHEEILNYEKNRSKERVNS